MEEGDLAAGKTTAAALGGWIVFELGGRVMLPTTANAAGSVDQRPVEDRDDVLCFTSPALTEPLEVTGHVKLTLFASSSAPDTDFTGKLVDVFPDGRAIFLTDGIIRGTCGDWQPGTPTTSS